MERQKVRYVYSKGSQFSKRAPDIPPAPVCSLRVMLTTTRIATACRNGKLFIQDGRQLREEADGREGKGKLRPGSLPRWDSYDLN